MNPHPEIDLSRIEDMIEDLWEEASHLRSLAYMKTPARIVPVGQFDFMTE